MHPRTCGHPVGEADDLYVEHGGRDVLRHHEAAQREPDEEARGHEASGVVDKGHAEDSGREHHEEQRQRGAGAQLVAQPAQGEAACRGGKGMEERRALVGANGPPTVHESIRSSGCVMCEWIGARLARAQLAD